MCLAYLALAYDFFDNFPITGNYQTPQLVNFEESTNTSFKSRHIRLQQTAGEVATSASSYFAKYNGYFYSIGY